MILLKLTLQSLIRHPRRAALILFAVALSVFTMEIVSGMLHGIRDNFFTNILDDGGHGQVRGAGWRESLDPYSLEFAIKDLGPIAAITEREAEVIRAEPSLSFGALLMDGAKSVALRAIGVRPDTVFYAGVRSGLEAGGFLPKEASILLSRSLAELMGLGLGDEVALLTEDVSGSPYYLSFSIDGIFKTDSLDFDESTALVRLESARDMTWLPDGATELRFLMQDRDRAPALAGKLRDEVGRLGGSIHDWRDLNAGLLSLVEALDVFIWFFNAIVIAVAATVITNAVLMNAFDRMREFGTLRAIGLRRRGVFGLILAEGAVLGAAGAVLGLAAGIPLVLSLEAEGLDWGAISEAFGMGSYFNFSFSMANSMANLAAGLLTALAGSLYAASVAGKAGILEALKES